jgi:hypothetical protein
MHESTHMKNNLVVYSILVNTTKAVARYLTLPSKMVNEISVQIIKNREVELMRPVFEDDLCKYSRLSTYT